MNTTVMFVQRCMFAVAILLFYFQAEAIEDKNTLPVICENYPFHILCRGSMSKKRAMAVNYIQGLGCDETKGDSDCIKMKSYADKQRHIPYASLPRSKLWLALLDDGLQRDVDFDAYPPRYDLHHKKRRNNEMEQQYDERRIPLLRNFLSDLETSDGDY